MATPLLAALLLNVLPTQGGPISALEAKPVLSIEGAKSPCDPIDRLAVTGVVCVFSTLTTPLLATGAVTTLLAAAVLPFGAWAPLLVVGLGVYFALTIVIPISALAAIPAWLANVLFNLVLYYGCSPHKASLRPDGNAAQDLAFDEKAQQIQRY